MPSARSPQMQRQKTNTLLAKNFGHLIFGHFLSHLGQILDKKFGHFS